MQRKRILWLSSLVLDMHLHKTTQIEILRALAKRGHQVVLVASYSSKKSMHELEDVNTIQIPLRYIPGFSTGAYVLLLLLYMPLFFLHWRPNIVITEPLTAFIGAETRLLFPKHKTILDIRSGPVGPRSHVTVLFFSIATRISKFFQGITTITQLSKKTLCERYKIDAGSVGVWTSGVSVAEFNPEKFLKGDIRKALGLCNRFVIFYHGYFGRQRGILETAKAIKLLREKYPNIILFLLGNGRVNMRSVVQELSIQDMVIVHDPVDYREVPRYIAICDVGIVPLPDLPYWQHQSPLKLLEYLAMQKVVIATDIPANREILGQSRCGIIVSSANPPNIAKAISYAYENREKLSEWGVLGRDIVKKSYSWERVAEDFEEFLLSACETK